jgi:eukaryotic-like serine/threonine-protein kinase
MLDRLAATLADRYRVEREVGQGGMATVYLAQDLKHERQVAIKVLRPELSAVIGAERFLREIKTIAGLQHPHILGLIDSGELDGTAYYVMPFVDGESLRDRLRREKQLPIADALRIATEVAAALDYAHRRGIIHRDIKPENILLHDGQAMVADFGIALAVNAAGGSRMTETGLSLGTPHYMSPEQAMGEREITARSDVYALGAITYEMLTGDPPFTGSTAQAIVAKVMTEKPAPPSRLRDTVPDAVEDAVLTALEKLPADRFATAQEFSAALRETGTTSVRRTTGSRGVRASSASRVAWPAALAAIAALAAWGWLRPPAPVIEALPLRVSVTIPTLGGSSTALYRQLALTPDGSTLLYIALTPDGDNRTMRLVLADTVATVLPGVVPFLTDYVFSPDGREFIASVGYTQMYRYPIGGGSGRPLPDGIAVGASVWAPDGTIWISASSDTERGLVRLGSDGTVTRPFGPETSEYSMSQVLPDGRTALAVRVPQGVSAGSLLLVDLETGDATDLISRPIVSALYTAGYLVIALPDGTLEAAPFDPKRKRLLGEPVQFATGVSTPLSGGTVQFVVADNGTVAYIPEEARSLLLVDRQGRTRLATPERRNFHAPMFSPDGRRISTDFTSADGRDVWLLDRADGRLSRATFDRDGHDATWTPDGSAVTWISAKSGTVGVYRARPGQAEGADSLLASTALGYTGHWLPDRSALVTVGNSMRSGSRTDIAIVRNGGRGPIEPLVATRFEEAHPTVSPDGRWLAFTSDQSGRVEVYLRPLLDDGDQVQVSLGGGTEPVFSRNGRELFYRAGPGAGSELTSATLSFTPTVTVTARTTLFGVNGMANGTPHANYDVSPDGQSFVMVGFNPASRIVIIQNLPALMARLRGESGGAR